MAATVDSKTRQPVLTVTQYDKASAGMISAIFALLAVAVILLAYWLTNRLPRPAEAVEIEMVEMPGGYEDGNPDETMELESPEEEIPDPSIAETQEEQVEIAEMLETIVELSDTATQQVDMVIQSESSNTSGKVGSASGTGGRPLGSGGGKGGMSREQRWFIKFDDGALDLYAAQLDFFKIELGAWLPDGRIVYISNLSAATPTKRESRSGKGETRLYMTWKGGNRKQADLALFQKAGIDASGGVLMHFYPKEAEEDLVKTETSYRNRKVTEIRRTYFKVERDGTGYKFRVTQQSYLR